jgi:hypothetical protein
MKTFLYHGQPFGSVAELVEHISYEIEMSFLVDGGES